MSGIADANGCFLLYGANGLPFEIVIDAKGFHPLREAVKAGSYQAQAVMAPFDSGQEGKLELLKSRSLPAKPVPGCA